MRAVASFETFRPGGTCRNSVLGVPGQTPTATAILGANSYNNCPSPTVIYLHLANLTLAYYYNNDNTIFFQFFIPYSFFPKAILQSKYYFFY